MFERFFSKKTHSNLSIGAKMRSIRIRKGISAVDLGNECGITDSAVRHYEGDLRAPKEEKLQEIAAALGVDVSALYDRHIESISDIMHILFEIEANGYIAPAKYQIDPNRSRTAYGVRTLNEVLNEGIEKWCEKRELWETEQITDDEYHNWKDAFPQEYDVDVHPEKKAAPSGELIVDYRQHALEALITLRSIMLYDVEQVENQISGEHARQTKAAFKILKSNLFHNLDREIAALMEEPTYGMSGINPILTEDKK